MGLRLIKNLKKDQLKNLKSDIKKLTKKERDLILQDLVKETK